MRQGLRTPDRSGAWESDTSDGRTNRHRLCRIGRATQSRFAMSAKSQPRYVEMPLSRLPRATAHRLIDQLFAPEQRFARCFHRYWRDTMGMTEAAATRATRDELVTSAAVLRAGLADPCVHTI